MAQRHIELNIGLHVEGKANTIGAVEARFLKATDLLDRMAWRLGFIGKVRMDLDGYEPTAVVDLTTVNSDGKIDRAVVFAAVYDLSVAMEQQCIALYEPARARGYLIGPKAQEWGAFRPELFARFAP